MSKRIVAYFSASGTTSKLAKRLANAIDADLYEIRPAVPYTNADLNYMNSKSRTSVEMQDTNCRPELSDYDAPVVGADIVFVGFPIWWYREPSVIDTFMAAYDFKGATVVPFATSGGSGLGDAARNMQALAPTAKVVEGKRFSGNTTAQTLKEWAERYL